MLRLFLPLLIICSGYIRVQAKSILVEAESFTEKGGWVVDQQFMDQMGSPYLMAHGLGKKVADASTSITIPEDGKYNVYVRTYNWTGPWSDTRGAGQFKISIGKKTLPATLGASGNKWSWQHAGALNLKAGTTTLSLKDLTGFNGRCDAILLTTDPLTSIPDSGKELREWRKALNPVRNADTHQFDVVVAGGGIAGMCAAVAAARLGSKVALINDRPVLGGNNSSEIRVHLGGRIEVAPYPGLGRMIREFGHSRKGNAKPADYYEDHKKQSFIESEPNIMLFSSYRVDSVTMSNSLIDNITAHHISDNSMITFMAPVFIDCTGDGTLGYLAGADYRMGRESRNEFGESFAPDSADSICLGTSVQWTSALTSDKNTKFPIFNYGLTFNDSTCEKVTMGEWTWETGMNRNQINDAERIRDYGLMVIFSNWSYLKNRSGIKKYDNRQLDWVAYIAGKRESRRLMGDYILKQDDIDKNVFHEDASFTTTWSIDLHFPDPANSRKFPGNEFKAATKHRRIYPYAVPYRCLYSRNIDNLLMAGRNISVTHVALGTVRVMRTTGMMGEVAGMAADICRRHNCLPRGVYHHHLAELKTMMQQGIGKPADTLPDNQQFNNQKPLKEPRLLKHTDGKKQ